MRYYYAKTALLIINSDEDRQINKRSILFFMT